MKTVLQQTSLYFRMIKFSHTIFALPLALLTLALALPGSQYLQSGLQPALLWLFFKVLLCMVFLRSAAMGFNRLIDAKIDAENPRTKSREIPAGKISKPSAWAFTIFSILVFLLVAITINFWTGVLSPLAAFAVLGYSFTKRFTWLCHYFLGFAIGLAPAGAWLALRASLELLPLLWSAGLLFYIAGFDILYSCQDVEFDQSYHLHSIPARFGVAKALIFARLSHVLAFALFIWAGWMVAAGFFFYAGMVLVAFLFVLEHWMVRPQKLDKIPVAFFHINAVISSLLFFSVAIDLYASGVFDPLLESLL